MDRGTARERFLLGVAGGAIAAAILVLPLSVVVQNRLADDEPDTGPATTAPGPDLDPAAVAAGEAHFQSTCSVCHGPDARGVEGLGKSIVGSEFVAGLSDAELVEFLKVGRPPSDPRNTTGIAMPPRGGNVNFTDADLLDIVAFIRSVN